MNGTGRVIISYRAAGQFAANVMAASILSVSSSTPFQNARRIAESVHQWVLDELVDVLPDNVEVTSVRCNMVLPTTSNTAIVPFGPGDAVGDYGTNLSATSDAPCVILIPEVPNGKVGKIFLPGTPESGLSGGIYVPAWLTEVQDSLTPFLIDGLAGITDPSDTIKGQILMDTPAIGYTISDFYVSPIQGIQRRRLRPT